MLLLAAPLGAQDRMQWFRVEKFGMFIHWEPYSKLAGEWNGRQVPPGKNAVMYFESPQLEPAR